MEKYLKNIIPLELYELDKEKNLIANLELISYTYHSNLTPQTVKYYRRVIDRASALSRDPNLGYELFVIYLILSFLVNIKNDNSGFFLDKEIIHITGIFFNYIEKILRIKTLNNDTYNKETKSTRTKNDPSALKQTKKKDNTDMECLGRKKEIVLLILNNFREEFYFRKSDRLIPLQSELPF